MKRKDSTIRLSGDQQLVMCKAADLWSTVYETRFSQVMGILINVNRNQDDGTGTYHGWDGSIVMAHFILCQITAPDTTEYMALEYARLNPNGDYAKFYQDAERLMAYIHNSIIKIEQDASDTNHEHAGAAAATA